MRLVEAAIILPTGGSVKTKDTKRSWLGSRRSVRQFDSVCVLSIALVLFCKHPFQPLCLFFGNPFIYRLWVMPDEELLAATVAPERSHLLEACCFLVATLFYRYRPHLLILD
jgi:hypothetical protein